MSYSAWIGWWQCGWQLGGVCRHCDGNWRSTGQRRGRLGWMLDVHAVHVRRRQSRLDGLFAQQFDRLAHFGEFAIFAIGRDGQLLEALRHVGEALFEGGDYVGLD